MKKTKLILVFAFSIILFNSCSNEESDIEGINENVLNETEVNSLGRASQNQDICSFYVDQFGNFTSATIELRITYIPIQTFYNSPSDYQTVRQNVRNQLLDIDQNITFLQFGLDKDILTTAYNQTLTNIGSSLCNAYTSYQISEVETTSVFEICFESNVTESEKEEARNYFIFNNNLEFIVNIDDNCEMWNFRGCCKTEEVGGSAESYSYTFYLY
ncbi:hypothetical protein [uncultured Lacinutrix sp.]|uniref:hypothetical protein n=1 Tax=uncultured Lacinutrix sp. TaxID=574032 RepID=UPI002627BB51|nr:hypothetical protein [uncultured Lacinutrix sp.]